MFVAGHAALGLPALVQVQLQHVDRVQRVDLGIDQALQGVKLRVEQLRRGQEKGVARVELGLQRPNVAQGLVGGVVVEAVELRQLIVMNVGVGVVVVAAQHDLVVRCRRG